MQNKAKMIIKKTKCFNSMEIAPRQKPITPQCEAQIIGFNYDEIVPPWEKIVAQRRKNKKSFKVL
jgi:hypothetical protein